MTRNAVTVAPDKEFREIADTMRRHEVTALPVVTDGGAVIGVVSEADLLPKEEFRDPPPGMIEQMRRLADTAKSGAVRAALMSSPAVTIGPDASLPQAARLMSVRRVKRLPVVDTDGRLEGVVSRADLLKVFLRPDEDLAAEIRQEVLGTLFPGGDRNVRIDVAQGVATLTGRVPDAALIPVAARLARSVEGVVGVDCSLEGPVPNR
ncbi:CBS domain-containing protein [Streptomyces sp. NPDC092952]|uniref:CBS domain-containing protein n=1 Tax=Streptomyces sp. NPDC092952 TaxID=3366018 RepID=UPI0038289244